MKNLYDQPTPFRQLKEKITSHSYTSHAEFTHEILPTSEHDISKKICQIWKSPDYKNEMIYGLRIVAFIEDVIGVARNVLWVEPDDPPTF